MAELFVGGVQVLPIRGIPLHTGNFVDAVTVAGLLADPELFGEVAGVGLVGHYLDAQGAPHRMSPYQFQEMANGIDAAVERGEGPQELVAHLLPGVFVFRRNVEQCLYGYWDHYTSRGCSLDRGQFEFDSAPRMTPAEEMLVYSGFEDLRTSDRLPSGHFCSNEERLNDARRVLRRLHEAAAAAHIPFEPASMPGRIEELVALLKRHSTPMMALTDDVVRAYINQPGYRFRPGRPRRDAPPVDLLYTLM